MTIKSLGGFEDGTHRREEYVSFLPEGVSVLECPDFRIRNMIFEFTAGLDLLPLLSLKQKRIIRQVKSGEIVIAETYLDRVNLKSEGREKRYNEFEVELKDEGTLEDLKNIRDFLLKHYNLSESPYSKFERAFLFMENISEKTFLSLKERAFCAQLADQKDVYGKQAKILLAFDEGQTSDELSLLLGIPQTEIETLRSKFEKERLSVFPFTIDEDKDRKFHLRFPGFALEKDKKRKTRKKSQILKNGTRKIFLNIMEQTNSGQKKPEKMLLLFLMDYLSAMEWERRRKNFLVLQLS